MVPIKEVIISNRFHNKWHRHHHHTYGTVGEPDSARDPIASPEDPFRGDLVLDGALSASAPLSAYAGKFYTNATNATTLISYAAGPNSIGMYASGQSTGVLAKSPSGDAGDINIDEFGNTNVDFPNFGDGYLGISVEGNALVSHALSASSIWTNAIYANSAVLLVTDLHVSELSGFTIIGTDYRQEVPATIDPDTEQLFFLQGIGLSGTSWASFGGDIQTNGNLSVSGTITVGGSGGIVLDGSSGDITTNNLTVNDTAYFLGDELMIPSGGTALRPVPPSAGFIRYNSDLLQFEGYTPESWGALGGLIDSDRDTYIIPRSDLDDPSVEDNVLAMYTSGTRAMLISSDQRTTTDGVLHASGGFVLEQSQSAYEEIGRMWLSGQTVVAPGAGSVSEVNGNLLVIGSLTVNASSSFVSNIQLNGNAALGVGSIQSDNAGSSTLTIDASETTFLSSVDMNKTLNVDISAAIQGPLYVDGNIDLNDNSIENLTTINLSSDTPLTIHANMGVVSATSCYGGISIGTRLTVVDTLTSDATFAIPATATGTFLNTATSAGTFLNVNLSNSLGELSVYGIQLWDLPTV